VLAYSPQDHARNSGFASTRPRPRK
jgi:hypothetical protein